MSAMLVRPAVLAEMQAKYSLFLEAMLDRGQSRLQRQYFRLKKDLLELKAEPLTPSLECKMPGEPDNE